MSKNAVPVVGMGATVNHWTDRSACTVVAVSKSGKSITLRKDTANRLGERYAYEPDPNGREYKATLRTNLKGEPVWKIVGGHESVNLDVRDEHCDLSF